MCYECVMNVTTHDVLVFRSPFEFTTRGDSFGWMKDLSGNLYYGMFIEGGRVIDTENKKLKTCLKEIAQVCRTGAYSLIYHII